MYLKSRDGQLGELMNSGCQ